MRSVFEGGVGCMSGGSVDRSRESGVLDREDDGLDASGEFLSDMVDLGGWRWYRETSLTPLDCSVDIERS